MTTAALGVLSPGWTASRAALEGLTSASRNVVAVPACRAYWPAQTAQVCSPSTPRCLLPTALKMTPLLSGRRGRAWCVVAAQQPPLTSPYQGGESFSCFLGARQPTGMRDCFEMSCHSEPFAVILSPPLVILSGAKNLALPLRVNSARKLAPVFLGRSARRRARFRASLGMTFHGLWVPVSGRA